VLLLKAIRQNHPGRTMPEIEKCMGIPEGTLRGIEKGRHLLPALQDGLSGWLDAFLNCVDATPEERAQVRDLAAKVLLAEWADELDVRRGEGRRD
jgi:hypothetical protein